MEPERTPEERDPAIERAEELRREMAEWRVRMGFDAAVREAQEREMDRER